MKYFKYVHSLRIDAITLFLIPLLVYAKPVTQEGVAYLYDYKTKSKTPLSGVSLTVADAEPTKSNNNGQFTLRFMSLQKGSKITNVRQPFFKGLKVFNKKTVDDWYIVDGKLELIMCDYEEFELVKKTYYEQGRKSAEQKYAKQQRELEEALRQGKLRENEYEQQLQELRESYQHTLDELSNSADAMARIDQSEISRQMQDVFDFYEQGEVDKAMEMLSGLQLAEGLEQSIIRKERSRREYKKAVHDSVLAVKNIKSALQLCYNSGEWSKVERYRWLLANKVGTPADIFNYAFFCYNRLEYQDSVIPYYKRVMEATEYSRNQILPHLYLYATAAYNLGVCYQSKKQTELANKYLAIGIEERKKYAKQSPNPNDEGHVAWALVGKAIVEMENENFFDAKKYLAEAEEIYDRIVALNPDEHSWALGRLYACYGDWYRKQSQYEEAEKEYKRSITLFREYIDGWPVEYLIYIKYTFGSLLAWAYPTIITYAKLNKFDDIRELLDNIFSYYEKTPLKDAEFDEETASKMGNISDCLIHVGMYKEAEIMAIKAFSIDDKQKWVQINIAAALLLQGKLSEAVTIYQQYKAEYKSAMLDDLDSFATNGIIPKEREVDVERIKKLLQEE